MKAGASFCLYGVLILALAAGVGCSTRPSDAQMASAIQAKLNADSGLQGKQLGVQAANGTVTLSGTVDNDAQREAAARYAASEAGVKQVVNNLQITPPAALLTAQAPPAREMRKPSPTKRRPRKSEDDAPSATADNPPEVAAPAKFRPQRRIGEGLWQSHRLRPVLREANKPTRCR